MYVPPLIPPPFFSCGREGMVADELWVIDGLEQLEGVERAYIHVDVTSNNLSGHLPR